MEELTIHGIHTSDAAVVCTADDVSIKDYQIKVKINTRLSFENGNRDLKYVGFVSFLYKHEIAL
jgi:hypothetical protein